MPPGNRHDFWQSHSSTLERRSSAASSYGKMVSIWPEIGTTEQLFARRSASFKLKTLVPKGFQDPKEFWRVLKGPMGALKWAPKGIKGPRGFLFFKVFQRGHWGHRGSTKIKGVLKGPIGSRKVKGVQRGQRDFRGSTKVKGVYKGPTGSIRVKGPTSVHKCSKGFKSAPKGFKSAPKGSQVSQRVHKCPKKFTSASKG